MEQVEWVVAGTEDIGGHRPQVLGTPRAAEAGVEFDGAGDGLVVDALPLAGWEQFTLEVVFRPAVGGLEEQRFVHLQEDGSPYRVLVETRLRGDRWFLDTYIHTERADCTLYAEAFPHPVGPWYHAALCCDGDRMRHYVNGQPELEGAADFSPLGSGKTSLGVRLNQVCWYKGAIARLRFSHGVLAPEAFLAAGKEAGP